MPSTSLYTPSVSIARFAGTPFRAAFACVLVSVLGCKDSTKNQPTALASGSMISKTELKVEQFCGNCHPLPSPNSFPKKSWPAEVDRGFEFYLQSGRTDLEEPLVLDAQKYFQSRAPEKIVIPTATSFAEHSTNVRLVPSPLMLSGDKISLTADIEWDKATKTLYFSDMANSKLRSWSLNDEPEFVDLSSTDLKVLKDGNIVGQGNHLCRVTPCDWNSDGFQDFLVAEIGSMIISDQKLGDVALYLGGSNNSFERKVLASHLARPVEAVAYDYDNDDDLDILIAEFGYNTAGCLSLLRNRSTEGSVALKPEDFSYETIDPRPRAFSGCSCGYEQ